MKKIATLIFFLSFYMLSQAQIKETIARSIGDSIQNSFYRMDKKYFNSIFNSHRFASFFLIKNSQNALLTSLNEGITSQNMADIFANSIISEIKTGSSYDFINYYMDEDENYYLRFRFFGDNGVNYHEYFVEFESFDVYYISDVYVYFTGEYLSETMSNLYLPMIKDVAKTEIEQSDFKDSKHLTSTLKPYDILQSSKVRNLIKEGKLSTAKNEFYKIEPETRKNKFMALIELQLIDVDNEAEYNRVLANILEDNQASASVYLLSVDKFLLAKKYDKALAMIDGLYEYTEDDFLNLMKGNIYLAAGNQDSAISMYTYIKTEYPANVYGYYGLFDTYYMLKDFDKVVSILREMQEYLVLDKKVFNKSVKKEYKDLLQVDAYKKWIKEK